ncbi:MAG TPA: TonB-dependent siderophore receptor [Steroidobacteraceae bacterium]|jgi:catecholate siderophore receptor
MAGENRGANRRFRSVLLAGTGLGILQAHSAYADDQKTDATADRGSVQEVYVLGERDSYKGEISSLSKLTTPVQDTPQSIATVTQQVMEDRAVTDFNEALRNVPGITIGAGEFRSLGNSPTIRGFSARTDMFLDGIRDYGDYFRDPFNLEGIEVLEGPSGILFGRGSTGGVIEQATKLPKLQEAISGILTGGTDDTRRATIDVNEPISALGAGTALRVNAMGIKAQVTDRDVVADSRWGFAPSLSFGMGTPTRVTLAYFHQYNDDIPDYGLPYFGITPAAVSQDNFYGFRSDYMRTRTDIASFKVDHDFSDSITLENQLRYASYGRDFRFSEPLIATTIPLTTPLSAVNVTRNDNEGKSVDTMLWDQFFGTMRFQTGDIHNTAVVGIEGGHEKAAPIFYNFSGVPTTPLLDPNENQAFTGSEYPRYQTHLSADSVAPFIMNTATLGNWQAILGVRWDRFDLDYNDVNYSTTKPGVVTTTDHIPHIDEDFSYRAALSYKITPHGNAYFSFGTSFDPSAEDLSLISSSRSFSLNNANLDPEKNKTFELGTKWDLLQEKLILSGSIFRLEKDNARVPDPTNPVLNILAGSQQVDGGEVRAEGNLTASWQVLAGYTYLDSKVTETAKGAAPVGAPLMNTPKHAFSAWTTYRLGERLEFGGGGRFVSSQYTQNVPPIKTVPGFWDFDAMAKYAITTRIAAQLNVKNLFNRYYYDQLHFFHVVPGEGRTLLVSISATY